MPRRPHRPALCAPTAVRQRPAASSARRRVGFGRVVAVTVALMAMMAPPSLAQDGSTTVPPTTAPSTTAAPTETTATPTTLSAEERRAKARAAGNLNAAKAADVEIASGLQAINEAAQTTRSKIDRATRLLETAQVLEATASVELTESNEAQGQIENQLLAKAVEGFKSGFDTPEVFFSDRNMNQTIRQTQLLQQANQSTAELLEELRALKEDRRVAQAEAAQAAADAEALQRELTAELETLREQQTVQLRLKAEAESRINKWESELSAYAAEDSEIQRLIADSAVTPVANPEPRQPSLLGYQWPIIGKVTSPYGYRIHPVYGTRKLHSGLDVSAARGVPISATSGGVVIYTGWRGGYGNTVIVDHGEGLSSLYAHMSQIGIAEGASVDRGDVVGLVGATGTATGNHLHFEIRLNGTAVNPAPYLP